jgi:galactonate dehydratase
VGLGRPPAADGVMIDPTWAGGITENKGLATMVEAFKRPVVVRAYLRVTYPEFVTELPRVEAGQIEAPTAPGIGTTLLLNVRRRPDVSIVASTA